jgi:hypothetical protein
MNRIQQQFERQFAESPDLYHFLNDFRDWVGQNLLNYEIFLEDNWFEDKTTIEYTWRCLDTFNIRVIAEDEYQNYRNQGTWHLGAYVKTYWTVEAPWDSTAAFFAENTVPRFKQPDEVG